MPTLSYFATVKKQIKNIPTPGKNVIGGVSRTIGGQKFRIGVYTDHFEDLKKAVKKIG